MLKEQNNISIKDIAQSLHEENPDMPLGEIINVIKLMFDEISDALICGDKVELRGFCSLHLKPRKSTYARNPRTNEEISVEKNYMTLNFRPSRDLLASLNENNSTLNVERNRNASAEAA